MASRKTYNLWIAVELDILRQLGPTHSETELFEAIRGTHTLTAIRSKLSELGIAKTAERLSQASMEGLRSRWRCADCGSIRLEARP